MKDKRINLKSTLNKKVTLGSDPRNLESINQQISEIHHKGVHSEIVRTTIHLPKDIHTQIKVYCANNSLSFKEFVTYSLLSNKEVFKSE